jgi:hypothetical protein
MHAPSYSTPFFPALRPRLAALGRVSRTLLSELRHATLAQIEERFAEALPASLFAQNPSKAHSRERIFTLARTSWGWVWQVLQGNTSCREVVRQVQALFALDEAGLVDDDSSGYCQARRNVALKFFENIFFLSAKSAEKAAPKPVAPLLGGRPIKAADGSGARLPDTAKNRAAYPPSSSQLPGTGFPYMRIVVLFSLVSGALVAHATGSLHVSELGLFMSLLAQLKRGDILLGDRAYGVYVVAASLKARGVDLIATVPTRSRKVDFEKAHQHLGPGDVITVWKKPYTQSPVRTEKQWERLPKALKVRLIDVSLERQGFRTEHLVIVTTLLDPVAYPACEIIAAHKRRWRMELTLDDLKTTLGMEHLHCKTPVMVKKELLVFLIAHNLLRWLMGSAATQEDKDIETISFKGAMDSFRVWSNAMTQCADNAPQCARLWRELLRILAADALPYRPGRNEPRAVKGRTKYPYLNRPRREFIERGSRAKRSRRANARKTAAAA